MPAGLLLQSIRDICATLRNGVSNLAEDATAAK
jgi:hypothetical protein